MRARQDDGDVARWVRSAGRALLAGALALGVSGAALPGTPVPLPPVSALPAAAAPVAVLPVALLGTADGGFLPTVRITIGGGETLTMMLDSGTAQLVTFPWAADRIGTFTDTGASGVQYYDGTTTTGTIARAAVELGGRTTADPVAFILGDACQSPGGGHACLGDTREIDGVIGIAQGFSVQHGIQLYSPFTQLDPEAAAGLTVRLGPSGGTLELGAPDLTVPGTVLLHRPPETPGYDNGRPAFQKQAPMCVVIQNARACANTTVDTGEHGAMIMGAAFEPYAVQPLTPHESGETTLRTLSPIATGTVVGFAVPGDPPGTTPFAQWTVSPPAIATYACTSSKAGAQDCDGVPFLNTGNALFLGRAVAFDSVTGAIGIGPSTSAASAPQQLTARATDGRITAAWSAPAQSGAAPVRSYLVTVTRESDGYRTAQLVLPADAGTATIEAPNGQRYGLSVAADNGYGFGQAAVADGLAPETVGPAPAADGSSALAATGSRGGAAAAAGLAAVIVAVAGLLLLLAVRRRRRFV